MIRQILFYHITPLGKKPIDVSKDYRSVKSTVETFHSAIVQFFHDSYVKVEIVLE